MLSHVWTHHNSWVVVIDSCHGLGMGHGSRIMRVTGHKMWSIVSCDLHPYMGARKFYCDFLEISCESDDSLFFSVARIKWCTKLINHIHTVVCCVYCVRIGRCERRVFATGLTSLVRWEAAAATREEYLASWTSHINIFRDSCVRSHAEHML